jgi:hypothetical protein
MPARRSKQTISRLFDGAEIARIGSGGSFVPERPDAREAPPLPNRSRYVLITPMQPFADMADAHEWTLRRLREMAGRLTEQAYLRASAAVAEDDEAHTRWMLVFDRMARGLRLSIALEARLARERRWDAEAIARAALGAPCGPRWRRAGAAPVQGEAGAEDQTCAQTQHHTNDPDARGPEMLRAGGDLRETAAERDEERDSDGLAQDAPLAQRIGRLQAILQGASDFEASPPTPRAERQALAVQRAERARRAASPYPPDEPWDVLSAIEIVDDWSAAPPLRGSG